MSQYRAYFSVVGTDPFGRICQKPTNILAAIDGTLSDPWLKNPTDWFPAFSGKPAKTTNLNRWLSFVKLFHDDYTTRPGFKRYFAGPGGAGWDSQSIRDDAYKFICFRYCVVSGNANVDIIGMSRGGIIANEVAHLLKTKGCTCGTGKKYKPVGVRFAGFYDPVTGRKRGSWGPRFWATSKTGFGSRAGWESVSNNIKFSALAKAISFPFRGKKYGGQVSRRYWQRPLFSEATVRGYFQTTHSGFMAAPTYSTEDPLPKGYNRQLEISESIRVDQFIRKHAISNGVPIGAVKDYDFGNLVDNGR